MTGLVNTVFSAGCIYTLQALLGSPILANGINYVIGIVSGYFLHARLTFRARTNQRGFILSALIACSGYLVNRHVLTTCLLLVGALISQAAAIISAAGFSDVMQSRFAFATQRQLVRDETDPRS